MKSQDTNCSFFPVWFTNDFSRRFSSHLFVAELSLAILIILKALESASSVKKTAVRVD